MIHAMTSVMLGLLLVTSAAAQDPKPAEPPAQNRVRVPRTAVARGPQWRLGVQAWTYNRLTLAEAIDKAKAVGVRYIEAFPGQGVDTGHKDLKFDENLSAEGRELVKKKLKEVGIRLVNYGVCNLGDDEKSARKVFEFAKDMGIQTLVAEPKPELMDALDKLTEEFKINVAIHNHPQPSPYWNPDTLLKAIKGHSKRIGSCSDTGHWVRSGLDPIECLKKLEGHVISLHFKDVNEKGKDAHDVPYGTGVSNVKGQLEELKRQGFSGVFSIEYEYNMDNPTADVEKCVAAFKKLAEEVGVKPVTPRE